MTHPRPVTNSKLLNRSLITIEVAKVPRARAGDGPASYRESASVTQDGLPSDLPAHMDSKARGGFDWLTDRQRTILELLARGLSNPEIGHELHLSRYTVAHHVAEMRRRTGAANRVDLVSRAHLAGALSAITA